MEKLEIVITTLFGLESPTAREVRRLGYETTSVEDGRVTFTGDWEAVYRANLWIRTGERVLVKMAEFTAASFDDLFEGTKAVEWQRLIGRNDAFPVKGYSLKSKLASVRDCQAIIKKAVADKLMSVYGISWLPEEETQYKIQFSIFKDKATIMIDTSGDGLHKRGYRRISNIAPIKETLAAAMADISRWRYEQPLCDPFCGSGTIPIEAAMMKRNIAPGIMREFACDSFKQISDKIKKETREEAKSLTRDVPLEIYASDIDPETVELAQSNALKAGVGDAISFSCQDARGIKFDMPYGTIICNPPYGERIGDKDECRQLYADIGKTFGRLDKWSYYIIVADEGFETMFGRRADKKRKLYNGMIKCDLYQFFAPRPPKNTKK